MAGEPVADGPEMVAVEAGTYAIGAGPEGFAYDNERPRHEVELDAFEIDRTPVTNGAYAEFVAETGAEPPMYWERDGDGWVTTTFGHRRALDPARPVVHVDCKGADAFARWAGKRLPTEFEWEAAATGADPERANLDQLAFGCAPAGAYADARVGLRRRADAGRRLGVDELGLPGLPRLRGVPVPGVLGGLLRRRLQGPARRRLGDAPRLIRPSFRNWDLAGALTDLLRPALRKGRDETMAPADGTEDDTTAAQIEIEVHLPEGGTLAGLAEDVREGLSCPFKELPPKYFYDERGSELFERITELPEYYPTRIERSDPRPPRGGDRRRGEPDDADRARLGRRRRRRAACSTR